MNTEFKIILDKIEDALKTFLSSSNKNWQNSSFGKIDSCINESHFSNLVDPCNHLISLGGKRWRPLFLVLVTKLVQESKNLPVDLSNALRLTPLVEFSHTASLIHDDIEDGADTRRGKPCSHITYGLDVSINAASWLYFESAVSIQNLNVTDSKKCKLYELFLRELRLLHLGQAMDIKWHRDSSLIPTQEEYIAMVRNKTGTLARLSCKIGSLCGGASSEEVENAGLIAQDIGVGFQIIDDVKNLTTGNPGKKRGDDVVEGKKSLPVLLHLKENPNDKEELSKLFAIAKSEGIESSAVEKVISLLTQSDSVQKAYEIGQKLVQQKSQELSVLFGKETETSVLIRDLFNSML